MSKQSRAKHQAKKKKAKNVDRLSRRQAQLSLELEAARAQLQREIPLIDRLMDDVRNFAKHILTMENRLKRTMTMLETGAHIEEPLMTRDEYILALQAELKKITTYKAETLNPLLKKMIDTHELKDSAERLLGEAEMQVALEEAFAVFTQLNDEVCDNTEKLKLQSSLKIEQPMPQLDTAEQAAAAPAEETSEPE